MGQGEERVNEGGDEGASEKGKRRVRQEKNEAKIDIWYQFNEGGPRESFNDRISNEKESDKKGKSGDIIRQ